jgi:hypothetical protein
VLCQQSRITEEDGRPNAANLTASSKLGRFGVHPHVFPKSAQVDWNVRVANLPILGVRKWQKIREMRTGVDRDERDFCDRPSRVNGGGGASCGRVP